MQWYEFTGTLGGSLWIWASSLSVFGLMVALENDFGRAMDIAEFMSMETIGDLAAAAGRTI